MSVHMSLCMFICFMCCFCMIEVSCEAGSSRALQRRDEQSGCPRPAGNDDDDDDDDDDDEDDDDDGVSYTHTDISSLL